MEIGFHFLKKVNLRNRNALKSFIKFISLKEKTKIKELSIIFCSDDYLLDINQTFLKHNYFTDIITFELSNSKEGKSGEIYISIDRINSNAIDYQCSIQNELHRVIFHGVLHLCGFKDKAKKEKLLMTQKENQYLNLYFKK